MYVLSDLVAVPATTDRETGPEIWHVDAGRLTHKGKAATIEDAFDNPKSARGSGANTPARSRLQTPAASVSGTPAGSGTEDAAGSAGTGPHRKKKKDDAQPGQGAGGAQESSEAELAGIRRTQARGH